MLVIIVYARRSLSCPKAKLQAARERNLMHILRRHGSGACESQSQPASSLLASVTRQRKSPIANHQSVNECWNHECGVKW